MAVVLSSAAYLNLCLRSYLFKFDNYSSLQQPNNYFSNGPVYSEGKKRFLSLKDNLSIQFQCVI